MRRGGGKAKGPAPRELPGHRTHEHLRNFPPVENWDSHIEYDARAHPRKVPLRVEKAHLILESFRQTEGEAQVLRMFEQVDAGLGRLTALVNNAGVVDRSQRVDEMSFARLKRMFDINVIGSFLCAREAVRRMSTRHGGRGGAIVNVSSAASRLGAPGQYVDYAAAKGAIDAMTIGLAKEVGGEGIRVNAVRPGLIETDIHASGGLPNRVRDLQHQVPMQRGGTADEVAQAIVWLLSPEASYTTMSLIEVSGGR